MAQITLTRTVIMDRTTNISEIDIFFQLLLLLLLFICSPAFLGRHSRYLLKTMAEIELIPVPARLRDLPDLHRRPEEQFPRFPDSPVCQELHKGPPRVLLDQSAEII